MLHPEIEPGKLANKNIRKKKARILSNGREEGTLSGDGQAKKKQITMLFLAHTDYE